MVGSIPRELACLPGPLVPPNPAREELDRLVDLVLQPRVHVGNLSVGRDPEGVQLLREEWPDALDDLQVVHGRDRCRSREGPGQTRYTSQCVPVPPCPGYGDGALRVAYFGGAAVCEFGPVRDLEDVRALVDVPDQPGRGRYAEGREVNGVGALLDALELRRLLFPLGGRLGRCCLHSGPLLRRPSCYLLSGLDPHGPRQVDARSSKLQEPGELSALLGRPAFAVIEHHVDCNLAVLDRELHGGALVAARLAHRLGELEHVRLHEEPAARRDARGEGSRLASGERSVVSGMW